MWYLIEDKPERPPAPRYWLGGVAVSAGRSIGRKHVNIRLQASSVSRNHARLIVQQAPFYSHPHPHRHTTTVSIIDSSAYGTFLKYPKGHPSAPSSSTHHIRLDKNSPFQIFDGALLSFGAPAAWWRLVAHPLLVIPSRLSDTERERLAEIAAVTGLDVADNWVLNATHLVTHQCCPRSIKFMSALAARADVVTPPWVQGVHHVVTNACIADARINDAAAVTTCLPEPIKFTPPFAIEDIVRYGKDVITKVFDTDHVRRRENLFRNITFVFTKESRRTRWGAVIEKCGGRSMLLPGNQRAEGTKANRHHDFAMNQPNKMSRQIYLRYGTVSPELSRHHFFEEDSLVTAMLTASLDVFNESTTPSTDTDAVPLPVDDDSDAISNESAGSSADKKQSIPAKASRDGGAMPSKLHGKRQRSDMHGSENAMEEPESGATPSRLSRKRGRRMSDLVEVAGRKNATGVADESDLIGKVVPSRVLPGKQNASDGVEVAQEACHSSAPNASCAAGTMTRSRAGVRRLQTMQIALARKSEAVEEPRPVQEADGGGGGAVEEHGDEEIVKDDGEEEGKVDVKQNAPQVVLKEDADGWQERVDEERNSCGGSDNERDFFPVPTNQAEGAEARTNDSENNGEKDVGDVRPFRGVTTAKAGQLPFISLQYVDEKAVREMEDVPADERQEVNAASDAEEKKGIDE